MLERARQLLRLLRSLFIGQRESQTRRGSFDERLPRRQVLPTQRVEVRLARKVGESTKNRFWRSRVIRAIEVLVVIQKHSTTQTRDGVPNDQGASGATLNF